MIHSTMNRPIYWTQEMLQKLKQAVKLYGYNWYKIHTSEFPLISEEKLRNKWYKDKLHKENDSKECGDVSISSINPRDKAMWSLIHRLAEGDDCITPIQRQTSSVCDDPNSDIYSD